jgi:hypothetical protein
VVGREEALAELLRLLKDRDYRFVTVTPATHARVLARPAPSSLDLRDVFGWNRPFDTGDVGSGIVDLLKAADALDVEGGRLCSRVRVASLGGDVLLHSAFPTDDRNSVFLGPDTYRFARFVDRHLNRFPEAKWLVDMGAGSGAGAIAASRARRFGRITMVDSNAAALELARANARAAGVHADTLLAEAVPAGADLVIANPPYMMDRAGRSYRDGGDLLGGAIALDWARQALARMAPGGTMLLYSGAAFVAGEAPLVTALRRACDEAGAMLELEELDPDVFGEELDRPDYGQVERIAALGAVIRTNA